MLLWPIFCAKEKLNLVKCAMQTTQYIFMSKSVYTVQCIVYIYCIAYIAIKSKEHREARVHTYIIIHCTLCAVYTVNITYCKMYIAHCALCTL